MADNNDVQTLAIRALDYALKAMNEAVAMTEFVGPAKAIEYIADYLNECDAADPVLSAECPPDWLSRWNVERKA